VDVADVLLETGEPFRAVAERKGIDLVVGEVAPAPVWGDRSQIRRLVTNLVANALEYTDGGGQVRIAMSSGRAAVRLEVRNTGRGIPSEDLARIFERFCRADPSRSRGSGEGVGPGLAIVARIAELHGGKVSVSSETAQGSSFVVELPLAGTGSHPVLTSTR
jgi:signal transduction histidine kinase